MTKKRELRLNNKINVSLVLAALLPQLSGKFGETTYNLPGWVWNNYTAWSSELVTNFTNECSGLCYFQHPDPYECSFSTINSATKTCALGSFQARSGVSSSTLFDDTSIYPGTVDCFDSSLAWNFFASSLRKRQNCLKKKRYFCHRLTENKLISPQESYSYLCLGLCPRG